MSYDFKIRRLRETLTIVVCDGKGSDISENGNEDDKLDVERPVQNRNLISIQVRKPYITKQAPELRQNLPKVQDRSQDEWKARYGR